MAKESKKWKCTNPDCSKDFGVGEWVCVDGSSNHVVTEKIYRSCDPPINPGEPADGSLPPIVRGRTIVCNIPPPKKSMVDGDVRMIGEGSVEFINGIYATTDPEIQYWLDKKPGYQSTEDQWKRAWLSKSELLAEKEENLRVMQERLENEQNALLAQVKQKARASA